MATLPYLFDQGAKFNRATAQCAVEGGSIEVMQELLDRGWDVNAKDSRGSPMLRYGLPTVNPGKNPISR